MSETVIRIYFLKIEHIFILSVLLFRYKIRSADRYFMLYEARNKVIKYSVFVHRNKLAKHTKYEPVYQMYFVLHAIDQISFFIGNKHLYRH